MVNLSAAVLALAAERPSGTGSPAHGVSSSLQWANSTAPTTVVPLTTSVVYTTMTKTITNCPPVVTDCPFKDLTTTVTVPLYTTICPVDAIQTPGPKPTGPAGSEQKTVTAKVTKIYTITSCPATVENCSAGRVTTEVTKTTYCPEVPSVVATPTASECSEDVPAPTVVCEDNEKCHRPAIVVVCKGLQCEEQDETPKKTSVKLTTAPQSGVARPTGTVVSFVAKPSHVVCTGSQCPSKDIPGKPACNGADCKIPVVSSATKTGLSLVLAVAGGFFALL
ncbi:hypothetical protein HIM_00664 [Hirsutella minnesotensis 3608]|nr:hypothetical protein HIM_00664 [Hirsutella minnesotensis 3608]